MHAHDGSRRRWPRVVLGLGLICVTQGSCSLTRRGALAPPAPAAAPTFSACLSDPVHFVLDATRCGVAPGTPLARLEAMLDSWDERTRTQVGGSLDPRVAQQVPLTLTHSRGDSTVATFIVDADGVLADTIIGSLGGPSLLATASDTAPLRRSAVETTARDTAGIRAVARRLEVALRARGATLLACDDRWPHAGARTIARTWRLADTEIVSTLALWQPPGPDTVLASHSVQLVRASTTSDAPAVDDPGCASPATTPIADFVDEARRSYDAPARVARRLEERTARERFWTTCAEDAECLAWWHDVDRRRRAERAAAGLPTGRPPATRASPSSAPPVARPTTPVP